MGTIYKQVVKKEDFPLEKIDNNMTIIFRTDSVINDDIFKQVFDNTNVRAQPLESGDTFYIFSSEPVKIGNKFKDYPATILNVFYNPKKWWQFWKRKKQIGYIVQWN